MLWYFVILKYAVKNKRHRMLLYFAILKCEVEKKRDTPHAVVLYDTEV